MVETDTILRHNLWWKHGKSFENYDKHLIEKNYAQSACWAFASRRFLITGSNTMITTIAPTTPIIIDNQIGNP